MQHISRARAALLQAAWLALLAMLAPACAQARDYSFGVIAQRSPVLLAQYWNPILRYVSDKSGVALRLELARTGQEHAAEIGRGAYDFIYSNHQYKPGNAQVGYRVLARPVEAAISGQIVVPLGSRITKLSELQGQEVVFPSKVAFVGYYIPMDAFLRAGVAVKPQFAGNQEGAMGQLKSGRVQAAAVNSQLMRQYAEREGFAYRVVWSSPPYLNIPVAAHPSVPAPAVRAVQRALAGMSADPAGAAILAESAKLVRQPPPHGFVAAADAEYENYRRFFRETRVKEAE